MRQKKNRHPCNQDYFTFYFQNITYIGKWQMKINIHRHKSNKNTHNSIEKILMRPQKQTNKSYKSHKMYENLFDLFIKLMR